MSWEPVLYKAKAFDGDGQIISWVQKFMELYLSTIDHPDWFQNVIEDLHGNFHVPNGKYFFDEEIIDGHHDRLTYAIKMIDLTINKMESITKKDFIAFISHDIKGSWCDITDSLYDKLWLENDANYKSEYIDILRNLKNIMLVA